MQINKIPGNWDYETIEIIDGNFEALSGMESRIIEDVMQADPLDIETYVNGLDRSATSSTGSLNNFGIVFDSLLNGVIHKVDIYASTKGTLTVGLATQSPGTTHSQVLYTKDISLDSGWNEVELNFPVQQNTTYNLFRRSMGETVQTRTSSISGWNTYPFMENGVNFRGGMYLDRTGTYTGYSTFYNIQIVNNLAQIYQIMTNSVKPRKQYHVGQNPPTDAEIWFKPLE